MDSGTSSQEATPTESKLDATMRNEIVKNLAECLIQSGGLLEVSNKLDLAGMNNQLRSDMSLEEAHQALLDVITNHALLGSPADYDLKEVMELDPNERGLWALEQVMSNISNEDSS